MGLAPRQGGRARRTDFQSVRPGTDGLEIRPTNPRTWERALAAALLLFSVAPANGYEQAERRGAITARLTVDADPVPPDPSPGRVEVRLSGHLLLTITVEGPSVLEVERIP